MIRETLTPGSRYAFIGLAPNGYYRVQRRTTTFGSTSSGKSGSGVPPNVWVRLMRSNNVFYSYRSADGTNWTRINSPTIPMATNVYMGFAVASGTNTLNRATLSHPTLIP